MKPDLSLYLLQDGTYVDAKECSKGKDGVQRHSNGLAVALKADGSPFTLADAAAINADAANAATGPDEAA